MRNSYSVGQINSYIKNMFAQDYLLRSVYVKGEVSNVKYHSSGHIYFTMKDKTGTLSCVMFAGKRKGLRFTMCEGQQIVCGGSIEIYERDGKYQLYAEDIVLDGEGLLYERYLKLKKELEEQGMFSSEYKRAIPRYVKTLGVVTASTGAVIQDIINVSTRRNPYIQIILYPAKVQGEGAKESIVNGIHALQETNADVIIVGRGGGSIEDLWAFNEEIVAQAIFDSAIPVISAVGHETDTTIADFVADLRAPTPSAAAELAVCDIRDLDIRIEDYKMTLNKVIRDSIAGKREEYSKYQLKVEIHNPLNKVREYRNYSVNLEDKLNNAINGIIKNKRHELMIKIEQMKALSPLERLNSGFALVEKSDGNVVKAISDVNEGDVLKLHLKDGELESKVIRKREVKR